MSCWSGAFSATMPGNDIASPGCYLTADEEGRTDSAASVSSVTPARLPSELSPASVAEELSAVSAVSQGSSGDEAAPVGGL
jgi:hypothetical protein